jgi:O-succinylbenzoate synthase
MRFYGYNIALHPSCLPLSDRRGIIVETEHGWGEAAPLPGFSKEPLSALSFALTSAAHPFPKQYPSTHLSALASTPEEAISAIQRGYRTLKYKVKGLSPEKAAEVVTLLQPLGAQLRIDANRCWSLEEAKRFLGNLDPKNIEYIEEPLAEPKHLSELPPFPFALDETLLDPNADIPKQVTAFVLKPTLLGHRLDHWIALGKKLGKTLSFSSSFESAIGLIHIARLQSIHAPAVAAGLDTYRSFTKNFFSFPIYRGKLLDQPIDPIDRSCFYELAP